MAKPWDITSPPTDAGKIVHYPGRFVSAARGSWAALIKYQARSRTSSSVGSDVSHLCLLSLLFVLIVSVIFKDGVAVERHIPFPHYSPHISSLNDY